mgnify:CR=1 FL=1
MDSEDFPKIVDSSSLTLHFCIVKDEVSGYSQGRVVLILLPFRQSVGVRFARWRLSDAFDKKEC